eukprot:gene16162-21424_t
MQDGRAMRGAQTLRLRPDAARVNHACGGTMLWRGSSLAVVATPRPSIISPQSAARARLTRQGGAAAQMKIRLFHLTFVLVAATVLVGALAMGGVMALNLRRGFADYLVARDREHITELAGSIGARAEQRG